jgi:hypothetical protein
MMGLGGQLGQVTPGYLADLLVVSGDPVANLRVLLNKANVRHVIKDGEVQVFPEDLDGKRFQFDRLPAVYSRTALTYEMVCGTDPSPSYTVAPWSLGDSNDLLHDIETLQIKAGQEALSSD